MITSLAINQKNNDLTVAANGNLAFVSDNFALSDIVNSVLQTQLGELPYAINFGVPIFETVFNGSPNIPAYQAALTEAVLAINGVTEVIDVTINVEDNTLIYNLTYNSIYGTGTVTNG